MKKLFTLTIVLLLSFSVYPQHKPTERTKADYIRVIQQFYSYLLSNSPVTVAQVITLFEEEPIREFEEYLFYNDCNTKHINNKDCDKLFNKYDDNSKAASIYFLKLREQTQQLTQGLNVLQITELLNKSAQLIDDKNPSSVILKLTFPNNRNIHFVINKYSDEAPYIGSIFLPDSSAADNSIYPKNKNYLKK